MENRDSKIAKQTMEISSEERLIILGNRICYKSCNKIWHYSRTKQVDQ